MNSTTFYRLRQNFAICLLLLLLAACSGADKDPYEGLSAKQLFDNAKVSLNAGEFGEAIKLLEALEARYPFGRYALQAQIDIAYAYYKYDEPVSAIAAADRFIKLNPTHPSVDYAWYLKGLVNYNRGRGLFDWMSPRDFAELDQAALQQAYRDFETLLIRFPNSHYATDSRQRMIYIRNKNAEHEYRVAEYYHRRGALVGAVNRIKYLIERYDGAPIIADALALMVQSYRDLKLEPLAEDALQILEKNYPKHAAIPKLRDVKVQTAQNP